MTLRATYSLPTSLGQFQFQFVAKQRGIHDKAVLQPHDEHTNWSSVQGAWRRGLNVERDILYQARTFLVLRLACEIPKICVSALVTPGTSTEFRKVARALDGAAEAQSAAA